MNRRLITAAVLGLGLGLGVQVHGQTATPSLKTTATLSDADRGSVKLSIATQVAKLSGKDAAAQTEARDQLANEVVLGNPSAAYVEAYTQALGDALLPLADSPAFRTRLNAAIVAARVAEKTQSLSLKAVVVKFMQDKSEPVVYYGVKAAGALIPAALKAPSVKANDPLITGVVGAVHENLTGTVTQQAYESLSLDVNNAASRKSITPKMVSEVVPQIHKVMSLRMEGYLDGIPDDPAADTLGARFLVADAIWKGQSAQQQMQSVQMMINLLANATRRAADYTDKEGRDKRDELVQTIKQSAKSVQVIGQIVDNTALSSAAAPLTNINVSTDVKVITTQCDELVAAAATAFPGLKKPGSPTSKQAAAQR